MEHIVNRNILPVPEGASLCLLPDLSVTCRIIKETHVLYKFTVFKANLKVQESYHAESTKVKLMPNSSIRKAAELPELFSSSLRLRVVYNSLQTCNDNFKKGNLQKTILD